MGCLHPERGVWAPSWCVCRRVHHVDKTSKADTHIFDGRWPISCMH